MRGAAGLLAGLLCLSACATAPGGSSSPLAAAAPRSEGAASNVGGQEALADIVESVDQLLASGRTAYLADPVKRSAVDYCRAGEDEIERGEFRAAVRDKSKALFVAQQDRDPLLSAECARSIAVAYSFAGLQRRAVDWADESQRYLDQAGSGANNIRAAGVRGPLLKVRADSALARGDLLQARSFLGDARTVAPDYYQPYVLVSLAQVDLARGDLAIAEAELNAATDMAGVPPELYAIIVRTKGELALAGKDLAGAAALFAYGASLAAQSGDSYGQAWAERGRAQVDLAQGRRAEATQDYLRAIQAAEQSRLAFRAEELRSGAFGTLQAIFDEAVDNLAAQDRWQEAFDASERGRARSLRELLRGQPGGGGGLVATAQQIMAAIPTGTVLVSYHMLPGRLLIWTLRPGSLRGVSVAAPARELENQVRSFTRLASRPGQEAALSGVAQGLYSTLIRPAQLQEQEAVVLEPFGILHNLAFAALRNGSRWLIEEHPLSEVLAAGSVGGARPATTTRGVVVFSDPDGSLPSADKEAAAIAGIVPGTTVFSGAQASKALFETAGPRAGTLHVAAHAEFDALDPLSSRIRLAGRSPEAGDLRAREIYGLPLGSVQTVVLSACETSIGAPSPGDEVIGFNRSFLAAGAQNLVSTLWSINDQATALLMALFYKNLTSGASLPDALRAAQLELLHNGLTASPYFWAPFTLTRTSISSRS